MKDVLLKDIMCWRASETSQLHVVAQDFGKNQIEDVIFLPTFR